MPKKNIIDKDITEENTLNILLTSIIVVLLIVYLSIVNKNNVPQLFNNTILKIILFGLVAYTFYHNKLIALFLALTIVLSISLLSKTMPTKHIIYNEEIKTPQEETRLPPEEEENYTIHQATNIPRSIPNVSRSIPNVPHAIPSTGLNINNFSGLNK